MSTSAYVELNHELHDGMAPYPGLPDVSIGPHLDHAASRSNYDEGEFFLGHVRMPTNVGTYIDAPFHRFRERDDLADIPLERLVGLPGLVLDASRAPARALHLELPDDDVAGHAVLIHSGWDERWGTDRYWEPGPFISEELATEFVTRRVGLVGVDFWNVDDTETKRRPIHTALLDAGIPIVEHLANAGRLPAKGFRFSAPVLRVRGGASFPVRAFAEIPSSD